MAQLSETVGLALFTLSIPIEIGHTFSPIVLAWSRRELRAVARGNLKYFVLFPAILTALVCVLPFWDAFGLYSACNVYHFGMQHFGVASLIRRPKSHDARVRVALLCVIGTVLGMVALPAFLPKWGALSVAYIFGFSHWLTDLGLSARVSYHRWLFLVVVLALGCLGFTFMIPYSDHVGAHYFPLLIKARWSLGMAHFIYSARIWKLSDPEVRAAICKELFK